MSFRSNMAGDINAAMKNPRDANVSIDNLIKDNVLLGSQSPAAWE